uniref:NgoMIV family type II restriction endonuclease n=1 Tax=Herbidospora sakaeratensis TaxID=564415 RepID=UPI000782C608|nr:NgoMIV family type II restriction endonuclease [Herbidospora sakaeratensis]
MNAEFVTQLLGWKTTKKGNTVPNTADTDNAASMCIAGAVLEEIGVTWGTVAPVEKLETGRPLERAVAASLKTQLPRLDDSRAWTVHDAPIEITAFVQYNHLKKVDRLVERNVELQITLGRDYLIKPDVVVSLPGRKGDNLPFLHAAVSCKWTIRSDRVQNIRHENGQMIRHRRERLPHLVTVTAEPLPSRLISIARGTGEVDAVYHIAYGALDQVVRDLAGTGKIQAKQLSDWEECIALGRIRPFTDLAPTLALW